MKMIFILFSFILLTGCNNHGSVKGFIPGTYTTEWQNEFNESKDTLIIEKLTSGGSETFKITRRTFFHYKNNIKKGPEYKVVRWTGTFDENHSTVIINNSGRILSFDPANSEMKMGTITYKKL